MVGALTCLCAFSLIGLASAEASAHLSHQDEKQRALMRKHEALLRETTNLNLEPFQIFSEAGGDVRTLVPQMAVDISSSGGMASFTSSISESENVERSDIKTDVNPSTAGTESGHNESQFKVIVVLILAVFGILGLCYAQIVQDEDALAVAKGSQHTRDRRGRPEDFGIMSTLQEVFSTYFVPAISLDQTWLRPELGCSCALLVFVWARLLPASADALHQLCESHEECRHFLGTSGRDEGDPQWNGFSGALLIISAGAGIHLILRTALGRDKHWAALLLSIVFVLAVHGAHTVSLLAICCAAYMMGVVIGPSKWSLAATWIYVLGLLVFRAYEPEWLTSITQLGLHGRLVEFIPQRYSWSAPLNFVCLKLISYQMDFYWASKSLEALQVQKQERTSTRLPYKVREQRSQPLSEYTFLHFMLYVFYPPLWIAGPIISFNAFTSQLRGGQHCIRIQEIVAYAGRWLILLGFLEFALRLAPVYALARSGTYRDLFIGDWESRKHAPVFVYLTCWMLWLKFAVVWGFGRLWAMCDGFECIENMPCCPLHIISATSGWRNWHVSLNRWLIRYIYIPLGGSAWLAANVWVVFAFTMVWHDIDKKLLAWGLLNASFIVVEGLAYRVWHHPRLMFLHNSWTLARNIESAAHALDMVLLMMVQLIGVSVGLDMLRQVPLDMTTIVLLGAVFTLYLAHAHIALHVRDQNAGTADATTKY